MREINRKKQLLIILSFALIIFSFSEKHDKYKGFNLKTFENSLALIPAGDFTLGVGDEDRSNVPKDQEGSVKVILVHVDSFYMSKYEVTNEQYLEFLNEIYKQDTNIYKTMLPDTLVWREKYVSNEPFVDYYLRHPVYSNYPVAGVSYRQAEAYCVWLTKKYLSEPKRKFKNTSFKLPTIEQWVFAAKEDDLYSRFPWKGFEMENNKGELRANFLYMEQAGIKRDSILEKNISGGFTKKQIFSSNYWVYPEYKKIKDKQYLGITLPVKFFEPNKYGLYNMAGNVEEFVREKGKTHGGSWNDPGYYLQNHTFEMYDTLHSTSAERGFRFMMEIKK